MKLTSALDGVGGQSMLNPGNDLVLTVQEAGCTPWAGLDRY